MKNKVLCLLCGVMLAFSLTACGKDAASDNVKDTDKQQVSEKEDEGGLFDKLSEKKKLEYQENYYCLKSEYNNEEPEKNKFTFANAGETFTLTGFSSIGSFYNGVAMAVTLEGERVIIDKKGKLITKPGEYSYMYRMHDGSDYFEAEDGETDLDGVIDKNGKVIVPFEYDDIDYTYGYYFNDFALLPEKDDMMDVYTIEGKKIAEKLPIDEYDVECYREPEQKYGVIRINSYADDSYTYYSEKTGEQILDFGEEWFITQLGIDTRFVSMSNIITGEERIGLLNEDWTEWTEIEDWEGSTNVTVTMVDGKWFMRWRDGEKLFDEKGKVVFDFEMPTYTSTDEKGNMIFITEGEDKFIIRDKNCKEIKTIENVVYAYNSGGGYFCGNPIVDGEESNTKNVYDLNGKLIFEDVREFYYSGRDFYNKEGKLVKDKVLIVKLNDDSLFVKTKEMKDFQKMDEGEHCNGLYMGYVLFQKDGEYIIRDKNLKEVGRLTDSAWTHDTFGLFISDEDGVRKYYNCKGEVLIEISN